MKRLFTALISAAALVATSQAGASVIRHDVAPEAYQTLPNGYPNVGSVWSGDAGTGVGESGSGTLIAPDWVLTAAHVVEGQTNRFTLDNQSYLASEIVIHPEWDGLVFNGHDLALVRLDRAVQGITPAAYSTAHDVVGQVATFVGYGQRGDGLTGRQGDTGTLNAGQNTLDAVGSDFWFLLDDSLLMADFDYVFPLDITQSGNNAFGQTQIPTALGGSTHINRMGSADPLALESLPGGGDSGGGVFIDVEGSPVLIGAVSMTLSWDGSNNSGYTDMVGVVSLASVDEWIQSTVPEPSSALVLGTLALLSIRRRRG